MGWWTMNKKGQSFAQNESGPEMLWGDSVADTMGDALESIIKDFQEDWGRKPTVEELHAGVDFSARVALEGS